MAARFGHLVVAVEDLDAAAARWSAAGLLAVRGGAHPVGTENALVRGPGAAYVELIAAGRDGSNPWLDRVRGARVAAHTRRTAGLLGSRGSGSRRGERPPGRRRRHASRP